MYLIENEVKKTQLPPGIYQEFADTIYKRKNRPFKIAKIINV